MNADTIKRLILIFSVPFLFLLLIILQLSRGTFTYTLDDPYIHLALAKNIWLGHYGINLSELSAPSSSIIWPFLLAPFSLFGSWFQYVPLGLNYIFLITTCFITYRLFESQGQKVALFISLVLVLSANVYGLVFSGMEHSLQVLLVTIIAVAITNKQESGEPLQSSLLGKLGLAAIILLPLVRYEGLAISVPVIAYLWAKGERKHAGLALVAIGVVITSFSLFLFVNGLGSLPTSVVLKSSHTSLSSTLDNLLGNLRMYWFMLIPLEILCKHYWHKDRSFSAMLIGVTALHFLFGHYGWFGRYEVYYVFFILLMTLHLYVQKKPFAVYYWLALPMMLYGLFFNTLMTPLAATNIYSQQVQMAQIVKLLDAPVAVNDLGLVSLTSRHYVLDLAGLGSVEVTKAIKSI